MTTKEDVLEALRLAVSLGGDPTSQIVPAAEAFVAFLAKDHNAPVIKSPVEKIKAGLDAGLMDTGSHPTVDIPMATEVKPAPSPPGPTSVAVDETATPAEVTTGTAPVSPSPGETVITQVAKLQAENQTKGRPPTQDQVRQALKEYAGREGQDAAMEILAKYGSTNITRLDERNYASVLKDITS